MTKVAFSTSAYRREHDHEPRGKGSWAFFMGAEDGNAEDPNLWWAPGSLTYTEAKKLATIEATNRGVTYVGVAP